VKASEDDPRVVIENSHTHKQTAYRITSIEEILGDAKEDSKETEKEQEGEEPEGEESDNESKDPNYDPAKGMRKRR
ncbi:11466_t:CDS:2, partial [Racocetra persica]